MRRLAPPLSVIEAGLFDPSPDLLRRWMEKDPSLSAARRADLDANPAAQAIAEAMRETDNEEVLEPLSGPAPELPAYLAALIDARLAAVALGLGTDPVPGLILRIDEARGPKGSLDWDLGQPLYVLLSEPTEHPDVWYGWPMAGELDYASHWDLILEEGDGPYDPDAAMVQLWNPVHLYCPSASAAVGRLSPARMAAVRDLSVDFLVEHPSPESADPGALVQRTTTSGHVIVTGTPLGDSSDPRRRYQDLYSAAADFVRDLTRHAVAELSAQSSSALLWWQQVRDALFAAAGHWGLPLEPIAALALGRELEDEAGTTWRLGDFLDLQLIPAPEGDAVQIHARRRGSEAMTVALEAQGEVRQSQVLELGQSSADLFAGVDGHLTLKVLSHDGRELFSVCLPEGDGLGTTPGANGSSDRNG